LRANFGDGTISGSEEEVSVAEEVNAIDTLREKSLGWANSLEQIVGERNFNNISGFSSKISKRISGVNDAADEDSLDSVHEDLGVLDLLLDEVTVPCSDTIVVDGQAL